MEGKDPLKIVDKRRFNPNGSPKEEEPETEKSSSELKPGTKESNKVSTEQQKPKEKARRPLPEISFGAFIISLATSAQVHLGVIPNPTTGQMEKNLDLAKQTIDIMSMLEKKTKGNLDDEENDILAKILYELRMSFVEASKKS